MSNSIPTSSISNALPTISTKFNNLLLPDIAYNTTYGLKYYNDAKHAANLASQFTICFIAGLLIFLAFCIFRTR